MLSEETLLQEQCGSQGEIVTYQLKDQQIQPLSTQNKLKKVKGCITGFFREVLLPYGYPDSVSEDYYNYQLWDTVQAFCSTITAAFTTRAILKGVGVGDSNATALSATITWILKDGSGMIGRILFAWWKGNVLDTDCKKWRLFADFLNDFAMMIELFLPYLSHISLYILCLTTGMKSIVGIAGGATRASITNHQAIRNNMAEISAKDGSQETIVNLVASFVSIFLLSLINNQIAEVVFILLLMSVHLASNYLAVKSLIFKKFNNQRLLLIIKKYLNLDIVLDPTLVNQKESVFLGMGPTIESYCGFKIVMGESLKKSFKVFPPQDIEEILRAFIDKNYFFVPDTAKKTIYVHFNKGETAKDIIQAYFHAVCVAIAISIYFRNPVNFLLKRQLHHSTTLTRINSFMRNLKNIPEPFLVHFFGISKSFMDQEIKTFFTALQLHDWDIQSHSLLVNEWRVQWKQYIANKKNV